MKITIDSTGLELSPSVEAYIEKKFMTLEKLVSRFETAGELDFHVEVRRTTKHHRKGEIYEVLADVRFPKKIVRAGESAEDVHVAIDLAKDVLKAEIEKYKEKTATAKSSREK